MKPPCDAVGGGTAIRHVIRNRRRPVLRQRVGYAIMAVAMSLASRCADADLKLKERDVVFSEATTRDFFDALASTSHQTLHGVVVLLKHPTAKDREELGKVGVHVLTPVQNTGYRVRVDRNATSSAIAGHRLRPQFALLEPLDRVEPSLANAASEKPMDVTVRVYPGTAAHEANKVLSRALPGVKVEMLSNETWLVSRMSGSLLQKLQAEDAVQWINRTPGTKSEMSDVRKATFADAVQKFHNGHFRGLTGKHIRVGLFDHGFDENHGDFRRRVVANDAPANMHATSMAGIIAGSGAKSLGRDTCGVSNRSIDKSDGSPLQWRGMAPKAQLLDIYQMPPFGRNGANAGTHLYYIDRYGMHISNHSYEFNTDSTYDNTNAARDQIVRGDARFGDSFVPPRLNVTSAGNDFGYFTLTKQVKNALVVGAWNMSTSVAPASLGPTRDGRIKPDVVAPGTFVYSTAFCEGSVEACRLPSGSLCNAGGTVKRQGYYASDTGSSVSAAVATGALALVLDRYRRTFPQKTAKAQQPLPSTLRAVIAHSARDVKTAAADWMPSPGPDFVTGWGMLDVKAAVDVVARKHLYEGVVASSCAMVKLEFWRSQRETGPLRITLAWDDVAADPALHDAEPKLVNDLDLVVIAPNGDRYFPWQLDQSFTYAADGLQCGTPVAVHRTFTAADSSIMTSPAAVRGKANEKTADHLNNIEVVDVDMPPAGRWQVQVSGFNILQGPQRFSLVGASFTRAHR